MSAVSVTRPGIGRPLGRCGGVVATKTSVDGEDADLLRLRAQAYIDDGVVRVPFVGTSWQQRAGAYWCRRIGAVVLTLVLTVLFPVALSAGFVTGIVRGVGGAAGIVCGIVYGLVAVPGFLVGRRIARRLPLTDRRTPRFVLPSGLFVLAFAPFAVGALAALMVPMFGGDFMGEDRAREVTEHLHDHPQTTHDGTHPRARRSKQH
jgi:hypothetical protein